MTLEAVKMSFRRRAKDPEILSEINLKLEAGEFVGLVGANGSGKSTLVRLLAGLLKPSQGEVRLSGGGSPRQSVGMVFQNPESQLVATVVEEEVAFGPENLGLGGAELRERVDWGLRAVRLEEYRLANPQLLSAGQKQRLAIAGVLAARPRFVLLDEPTSFLDPQGRRELLELLLRLRSEFNLGIVYITHHLDELEGTDRIIILEKGKIALEAPTREGFLKPDLFERLGLDLPYHIQIQRLLSRQGWTLPRVGLPETQLLELLRHGNLAGPISSPVRSSSGTAIQVENLSRKHFNPSQSETRMALQKQSWELDQGLCLGIIGPTGSGKSTLVQHLNGLLRPQTGRVRVGGLEIPRKGGDLRKLREQVGFLFQSPERQFFEETVAEEVGFAARNFGHSGEALGEAVHRSLERVGLDPETFVRRSPFELSGGERRLVALASVLAASPQILVMDEPTAGLDAHHRQRVLDFLRSWEGTRVVISHHLEELASLADRLLLLRDGALVCDGPARGLFGRLPSYQFEPSIVTRFARQLVESKSSTGFPLEGDGRGRSGFPLEGDGRGRSGFPLEGDGRGSSGFPLEGEGDDSPEDHWPVTLLEFASWWRARK